jgi:uncharacterized membrane protein YcaP (DUF421 family)
MNAFEFVVRITFGPSLPATAPNKSVLWLMESQHLGYIYLHNLFYFAYNTHSMNELMTSSSTLLFYKGDFCGEAMKRERISEEEIFKTSRMAGLSILDDMEMIILESTGDISIVKKNEFGMKNTVNHLEKKMEEDLSFSEQSFF